MLAETLVFQDCLPCLHQGLFMLSMLPCTLLLIFWTQTLEQYSNALCGDMFGMVARVSPKSNFFTSVTKSLYAESQILPSRRTINVCSEFFMVWKHDSNSWGRKQCPWSLLLFLCANVCLWISPCAFIRVNLFPHKMFHEHKYLHGNRCMLCIWGGAVLPMCMCSLPHAVYTGKLLAKTVLLCLYFIFEYVQSQVTDKEDICVC